LPHDYRNDRPQGARLRGVEAIVVQFMPNLLGDDWLRRAAMGRVRELFQRAHRGLQITGPTRSRVTRMMAQMVKTKGLPRVILLLETLECLANSEDLAEIASPGFDSATSGDSSDRIGPVCDYIESNLAQEIYLADLARLAGLSESAFSRLFKKSTGRTVPKYINELRIARACRLLAETDRTASEIADLCGYPSPAHFQQQFRRFEHRSPLVYRAAVRGMR
jgi:AraC-like DNA-binding protein